jgi:hypothetical protein
MPPRHRSFGRIIRSLRFALSSPDADKSAGPVVFGLTTLLISVGLVVAGLVALSRS